MVWFARSLLVALIAGPGMVWSAAAVNAGEACDKAWFTRNLIAHRGGHCFSSNLGKGMFGNDNCRRSGAKLTTAQRNQMASIKQMEEHWNCDVDTSQRTIAIVNRPLLEKLDVFPVRDDTESSCMRYRGAEIALRAAPRENARPIGAIVDGSDVGDSHLPNGDWTYSEVYLGSEMVASGWHQTNIWDGSCENYAG